MNAINTILCLIKDSVDEVLERIRYEKTWIVDQPIQDLRIRVAEAITPAFLAVVHAVNPYKDDRLSDRLVNLARMYAKRPDDIVDYSREGVDLDYWWDFRIKEDRISRLPATVDFSCAMGSIEEGKLYFLPASWDMVLPVHRIVVELADGSGNLVMTSPRGWRRYDLRHQIAAWLDEIDDSVLIGIALDAPRTGALGTPVYVPLLASG